MQNTRHNPSQPSQPKREVSNIEFIPHDYQTYAIQRITDQRQVALFLEPGLGKTVITLTAIQEFMYDRFEIYKVLVIAPLRVAEDTWSRECEKWDHLKHLRISKVLGSASKRLKALQANADIFVINRENVEWLSRLGKHDFDMIVVDELSSFKNQNAKRFKALAQMMVGVKCRVGLTGTPTPNGLIDLWSQLFIVDGGASLGMSYSVYLSDYFQAGRIIEKNGKQIVLEWKFKNQNSKKQIYERISKVAVSMRAKDWLTLPARIDNVVKVTLDKKSREYYEMLERDLLFELEKSEIRVSDNMALPNKLLQITNGACYDTGGVAKPLHDEKLKALEELVEAANGHPVLVFYNFQHDYIRIQKHLASYRPVKLENADDIRKWNEGKIDIMLAHPASAGHGLNLQAGGHIIVWFGLTWSLELYEQANARLHRQGQEQSVIVHHIIAEDTIDETVLQALKNKANVQNALMDAVKAKLKRGGKAHAILQ